MTNNITLSPLFLMKQELYPKVSLNSACKDSDIE